MIELHEPDDDGGRTILTPIGNGVPHDPVTGEIFETDAAAHNDRNDRSVDGQQTGQTSAPELPLGIPEHVPGESKAEAFVRLAEARCNRVLNDIRLIGNLANRSSYEYDQQDVDDILGAIRLSLDDTARRFRVNSPRPEFRLRR